MDISKEQLQIYFRTSFRWSSHDKTQILIKSQIISFMTHNCQCSIQETDHALREPKRTDI